MLTISTDGYKQSDKDLVDLIVDSIDRARQGSAELQTSSLSTTVNTRMLEIAENNGDRVTYRQPNTKEKKELLVSIHTFGVREITLGSGLCYEQTKVEDWSLYCRTCCQDAVLIVSHPDIERIWSDVVDCAFQGAAAATLAAILASPAAALATFKGAFYACLIAKGNDWANAISVDLIVRESCGNWRPCL